MKKLIAASALACTMAYCGQPAEPKTDTTQVADSTTSADGWISLFDGKTADKWHKYNGTGLPKAWTVVDGTLHFDSAAKKADSTAGGSIVTNDSYDNFHLKLEWKIAQFGNSGIMFLVNEIDTLREAYLTGPEMQVLDNNGHPDSKIPKHRAGDLYDLVQSSTEMAKPFGEWNLAEIIYNNDKLELKLNGTTTVSTTVHDSTWNNLVAGSKFKNWPFFAKFKSGKISLQDHGNDVWFRNIMIKKL